MRFPVVDLTGETEKFKSLYKDEKAAHRMTRVKLEVRTWFLRVSLAFNVAFITGIIIRLVS